MLALAVRQKGKGVRWGREAERRSALRAPLRERGCAPLAGSPRGLRGAGAAKPRLLVLGLARDARSGGAAKREGRTMGAGGGAALRASRSAARKGLRPSRGLSPGAEGGRRGEAAPPGAGTRSRCSLWRYGENKGRTMDAGGEHEPRFASASDRPVGGGLWELRRRGAG